MAKREKPNKITAQFLSPQFQVLVLGKNDFLLKKIETEFNVSIVKTDSNANTCEIVGDKGEATLARDALMRLQDIARDTYKRTTVTRKDKDGNERQETVPPTSKNHTKVNKRYNGVIKDVRRPAVVTEVSTPSTTAVESNSSAAQGSNTPRSPYRSEDQAIAHRAIVNPKTTFSVLTGGPGSGKSYAALKGAFDLLDQGEIDKVIAVRPRFKDVERMGAVPGTMDKKMHAHIQALAGNIKAITNYGIDELIRKGKLEIFAYNDGEQGITHNNRVILLDDAQSIQALNLRTMIGRMGGPRGRTIITGDISGGQDTLSGKSTLTQVIRGFGRGIKARPELSQKFDFVAFSPEAMSTRHRDLPDLMYCLDQAPILSNEEDRMSEKLKRELTDEQSEAQTHMETLDGITREKYQSALKIA